MITARVYQSEVQSGHESLTAFGGNSGGAFLGSPARGMFNSCIWHCHTPAAIGFGVDAKFLPSGWRCVDSYGCDIDSVGFSRSSPVFSDLHECRDAQQGQDSHGAEKL